MAYVLVVVDIVDVVVGFCVELIDEDSVGLVVVVVDILLENVVEVDRCVDRVLPGTTRGILHLHVLLGQ